MQQLYLHALHQQRLTWLGALQGPFWGDSGYIKLVKDMKDAAWGQCGVAMVPSYPIKKTPNPPKPAPTPPEPPKPKPPTPPKPTECSASASCPGGVYHFSPCLSDPEHCSGMRWVQCT